MSRLTKKDYKEWVYVVGTTINQKASEHLNYINHKLGELEDLEDELGCPLEVVFKLKDVESIFVKGYGNEFDTWETDDFYLVWERTPYIEIFKNGEPLRSYLLKDYKKTWWVKEDLSECTTLEK